MTITFKSTFEADSKDLLLEQFKSKANVEGTIGAFAKQVQEAEDVLEQLLNDRTVDGAVGNQLDVLGRVVGQDRDGRDDATYRLFIKARIQINRGSGTPEQILTLARLLTNTDTSADISIIDEFPAFFVLEILEPVTEEDAAVIFELLNIARPAGVGAALQFTLTTSGATFTFDGTTAQGFDNGLYSDILT